MVKKVQKMAEKSAAAAAGGLLDSQLAQTVKDSAQQIWLAGLGAFAKAQGGGKVFETLMKEGVHLQRKTQAAAGERLGDVAGRMSAMAGEVGIRANARWDKLESIFEESTARSRGWLGVPTARDLAALVQRVAALEAEVAALRGGSSGAAKAPKFKPGKALKDAVQAAPAPAARPAARTVRKKAPATAATAAPAAAPVAAAPRKRRSAKTTG